MLILFLFPAHEMHGLPVVLREYTIGDMLMDEQLNFIISAQPTETTCGPACLHSIYNYFSDDIALEQVVQEVSTLEQGGTLAVFLGCHALKRGYSATIYTYNLNVFDPTWFVDRSVEINKKLEEQMKKKNIPLLHEATKGYIEFLSLGGELRFEDLTTALIRKHLKRSVPILTGLSSTYLYRSSREVGYQGDWDDIRGEPAGHFVVLCGYNRDERSVMVGDPFLPNPYSDSLHYTVNIDRVVCSILLGVLTHDANLLIIKPGKIRKRGSVADPHCR